MYLVLGLIYSYSNQNIVVLVEGKTHQWNKIGNPDIDPYTYTQLISDKGTKKIQWRKDSFFSKWFWSDWIFIGKKKIALTQISCFIQK